MASSWRRRESQSIAKVCSTAIPPPSLYSVSSFLAAQPAVLASHAVSQAMSNPRQSKEERAKWGKRVLWRMRGLLGRR